MIEFHEVSIGTGGLASCLKCRGASRPLQSARSSAEVVAELADIAGRASAGTAPNVSFVGFEPFAHPELPLLIQAATTAGFARIRLMTDGGALASPGNAAGALHAGVRHVEVVMLGGDASVHDALTGRAGLFDAVVRGLGAFAGTADEQGEPVALTGLVPVCRHNVANIADAVAVLGRLGALSVRLEPQAGYVVSPEVIDAAVQSGMVNRVWVHAPGQLAPWCTAMAAR